MSTTIPTHTPEAPTTTRTAAKKPGIVGRRALIGVAATGAVGAAALAVPQIRNGIEQGVQNMGQQVLNHELNALENVSLDDAIRAAEITKAAVQVIVLPLAKLVSVIGGDALGVLLASLTAATNVLGSLRINVVALTQLRDTVASWHNNISSLP